MHTRTHARLQPHVFSVTVTQPVPRVYTMQANNDADMQAWIAAIEGVVRDGARRPSAVAPESKGKLKQTLRPLARRVMNANATVSSTKRNSLMPQSASSSSADKRLFTKVNHMSQHEGFMEKKGNK